MDVLQVGTATGAGGLSTDTLYAPVVVTQLGAGIATLGALLLLVMERAVATAAAQGVGLGVAFSEAAGSFGLHTMMDGLVCDGFLPFNQVGFWKF